MRFGAGNRAFKLASAGLSLVAVTVAIGAATSPLAASQPETMAVTAPAVAPVAPASLFSAEALAELQAEALAAEREGIDPSTYDIGTLATLAATPGADADRVATAMALQIAEDYATGTVENRKRLGWHIEGQDVDQGRLAADLRTALAEKRLRPWLRSLLPTDARYAALRAAYVTTPAADADTRQKLRANMERWRWMPRVLGDDHIFVNVPSYQLRVVDNGAPVSTYTVVVGAPSTPTPQIAVTAQSVVVNPWWNVPPSIIRSSNLRGRAGYVTAANGAVRQPPGPRNALGRVKIDMPNPHAIYLHDTPSKALFERESRAFSHGCIRVKDIDRLAAELMELDRGDSSEVERALAGSSTRAIALQRGRPVYLVYFTMEAAPDGTIIRHEDPYGRDTKLIASIERDTKMAAADRRTTRNQGA